MDWACGFCTIITDRQRGFPLPLNCTRSADTWTLADIDTVGDRGQVLARTTIPTRHLFVSAPHSFKHEKLIPATHAS
eukprot:scaffold136590_cov34-Tisochrysis_lutea.AAC.1